MSGHDQPAAKRDAEQVEAMLKHTRPVGSAAKRDAEQVEAMLKHTRPVGSAAQPHTEDTARHHG